MATSRPPTSVILAEFVGMGTGLPAALDFVPVVAVQDLFLIAVLRLFGSQGNERVLIAFAAGLVVPIAASGLISEISLPLTLLPDLAIVFFLRPLWKTTRVVITAN